MTREDRAEAAGREFASIQRRETRAVPDTDGDRTTVENGRRQARATVRKDGTAIKLFTFLPTNPGVPTATAATEGTTPPAKTQKKAKT